MWAITHVHLAVKFKFFFNHLVDVYIERLFPYDIIVMIYECTIFQINK